MVSGPSAKMYAFLPHGRIFFGGAWEKNENVSRCVTAMCDWRVTGVSEAGHIAKHSISKYKK